MLDNFRWKENTIIPPIAEANTTISHSEMFLLIVKTLDSFSEAAPRRGLKSPVN